MRAKRPFKGGLKNLIETMRGLSVPHTHKAYEIESTCSFGDLLQRPNNLQEDESIVKTHRREGQLLWRLIRKRWSTSHVQTDGVQDERRE